ncbi:hypothetical protein MHU86_13374 [Fragilaria crotonensis]|nr:hypothetical protein MHU86_13374 [Fragilaria crotonensis]
MANGNEAHVNLNVDHGAILNANATKAARTSPCDLHDAILANSQSVVELYLERNGADPNRSPRLPPVAVVSSAETERAKDLHRTLGRVFRRCQGGTIHPLHVAVCNAYHHCSFGRDQALGIVKALLRAGACTKALSSGMVYCKIGTHASVTIATPKTADKVALFLKRFPLPNHERECCHMMDEVATLILQEAASHDLQSLLQHENDGISLANLSIQTTYHRLLYDTTFTDITFQCPDGDVDAHRCVLASATPYFRTAFQGPWKDSQSRVWNTANSVSTMRSILKYMYTGQVDDYTCMHTILSVASEYQLESLEEHCEDRLVEFLSIDTIQEALELSHLHHLTKLQEKCFEFIYENATTVLVRPEMMSLSIQIPELWKDLLSGMEAFRSNKRKRGEALGQEVVGSADEISSHS